MAKRKQDDEFYEMLGYDETLSEFEESLGIEDDVNDPLCVACGSPFYPKCIDSCPFSDD